MAPSPKEFVGSTLGPFLAGTFLNYLMVHFSFHLEQIVPQSLRCVYPSDGDRVRAALQLFSQVPKVLTSLNDLASSPLMKYWSSDQIALKLLVAFCATINFAILALNTVTIYQYAVLGFGRRFSPPVSQCFRPHP